MCFRVAVVTPKARVATFRSSTTSRFAPVPVPIVGRSVACVGVSESCYP